LLCQVNGESLEVAAGASISKLLIQLGVGTKRVAVELNLEIVPKSTYDSVVLKDGDRVEVVGFVGGG
jgi:sulfur carrier protein